MTSSKSRRYQTFQKHILYADHETSKRDIILNGRLVGDGPLLLCMPLPYGPGRMFSISAHPLVLSLFNFEVINKLIEKVYDIGNKTKMSPLIVG